MFARFVVFMEHYAALCFDSGSYVFTIHLYDCCLFIIKLCKNQLCKLYDNWNIVDHLHTFSNLMIALSTHESCMFACHFTGN